MTAASRLTQGLCLIAAFGLHLAGFGAWSGGDETTQIAAAGTPAHAPFGASFADLAVGVMQPTPTTAAVPVQPVEAQRITARSDIPNTPLVVPLRAVIPQTAPAPPVAIAALPDTAPFRSIRPVARPPDLKPHEVLAQTGNASRDAVAGTSNVRSQGQASQAGSNATALAAPVQSNAAATNYPGEVLRRIANVRRPHTNARGVAVVSFSIAQNGNVADLGILRSSGDRNLDQIAQRVVRMAAPFPPPPSGAKTDWQIEIAGR